MLLNTICVCSTSIMLNRKTFFKASCTFENASSAALTASSAALMAACVGFAASATFVASSAVFAASTIVAKMSYFPLKALFPSGFGHKYRFFRKIVIFDKFRLFFSKSAKLCQSRLNHTGDSIPKMMSEMRLRAYLRRSRRPKKLLKTLIIL